MRQTAELKVYTGPLRSGSYISGAWCCCGLCPPHPWKSMHARRVLAGFPWVFSKILDLWGPLSWAPTVQGIQTATSFKPWLVFGRIRIKRKLIGWCFGAPWSATGSLVRQFESSSTSAERKRDCLSTSKPHTKKQLLQSDSPALMLNFLPGQSSNYFHSVHMELC